MTVADPRAANRPTVADGHLLVDRLVDDGLPEPTRRKVRDDHGELSLSLTLADEVAWKEWAARLDTEGVVPSGPWRVGPVSVLVAVGRIHGVSTVVDVEFEHADEPPRVIEHARPDEHDDTDDGADAAAPAAPNAAAPEGAAGMTPAPLPTPGRWPVGGNLSLLARARDLVDARRLFTALFDAAANRKPGAELLAELDAAPPARVVPALEVAPRAGTSPAPDRAPRGPAPETDDDPTGPHDFREWLDGEGRPRPVAAEGDGATS